jgi:hypothetical protein
MQTTLFGSVSLSPHVDLVLFAEEPSFTPARGALLHRAASDVSVSRVSQ